MSEALSFELPMSVQDIETCIPHRYPFLLIDRILDYTPGERIIASKNVSVVDPILQGHFPGNPIVPGVLIVEGMAQASAVLGKVSEAGFDSVLLTEVTAARFRKPVVPGDVLKLEVKVLRSRRPFYWFEGEATVDGEQVAAVKFSARLA